MSFTKNTKGCPALSMILAAALCLTGRTDAAATNSISLYINNLVLSWNEAIPEHATITLLGVEGPISLIRKRTGNN